MTHPRQRSPFRALVLVAALAGALMPVRSLAEDDNQLPERATSELSPELLSLLHQKKMREHSPIILRIFKEEAEAGNEGPIPCPRDGNPPSSDLGRSPA